jgi:carbon-monoxide dehydrogenase medium subunit
MESEVFRMGDVEYLAPKDLREALKALEKWKGRAKVIAGGTNLIPYMRSGWLSPEVIIDLSRFEDLAYVREENGYIAIGALTTISEVASSEIIRNQSPILAHAAGHLGNPLCRNRATIGGNLANASPGADSAPPLLALEASVHVERGRGKAREIPLERFFLGPNKSVLKEEEVITKVTFQRPKDPTKGRHIKFGLRNADALSIVSIAVMLEIDGKVCQKARIALCPLAPKPIRAYRVEGMLEGNEIDSGLLDECSAVLREDVTPRSGSIRASTEYRKMLASVLLKRAVQEAMG